MAKLAQDIKIIAESKGIKQHNSAHTMLKHFNVQSRDFTLSWNDASQKDWPLIKKFFISAYLNAYRHCSITDDGGMALNPIWSKKAESFIENVCILSRKVGTKILDKTIFETLEAYFSHTNERFTEERSAIRDKIENKKPSEANIAAMQRLIKYFALIFNFESMFDEEMDKILKQHHQKRIFDIQYIVARYHEHPIGFISCSQNYKSGNVYLRYVTVSPGFHRLHIGQKMLKAIEKHYNTSGLELYTREHNKIAKQFYSQYGFVSIKKFWSDEPIKKDNKISGEELKLYVEKWLSGGCLFPPLDDATSRPDLNVGFITRRSGLREW